MSVDKRCIVIAVMSFLMPLTVAASDWEFRLTPYLWFAGLEGELTPVEGLPSVPVDVSSSQALEDTETALFLMFDARRSGHGLYLDFIYTDVRSDEEVLPELGISVRSVSKSTLFSGAYEYQISRWDGGSLEGLVGARYWEVDSKLSFSGPLGLSGRNKEDWIDPLVGIKGSSMLGGSKFYVAGGGSMGGFGVGSQLFYEINANVGYRWTDSIGTALGYRYFDVDYDESSFKYDVKQQGWQVSFTWMF